jgi:DNA-binding Lrp family transcriptional regulator
MLQTSASAQPLATTSFFRPSAESGFRLDRLDIKILAALQTDGRMTNLKLAEFVGLSPTPCLQRVRRLEGAGYIRTYEAVLDVGRLASHLVAFTQVTLSSQRFEDTRRFERFIQSTPWVMECFAVGAGYDYLVQSVARDVHHYQEFTEELLSEEVGAKQVASFITLKTVKRTRAFPLELLNQKVQALAGMRARG